MLCWLGKTHSCHHRGSLPCAPQSRPLFPPRSFSALGNSKLTSTVSLAASSTAAATHAWGRVLPPARWGEHEVAPAVPITVRGETSTVATRCSATSSSRSRAAGTSGAWGCPLAHLMANELKEFAVGYVAVSPGVLPVTRRKMFQGLLRPIHNCVIGLLFPRQTSSQWDGGGDAVVEVSASTL